MATNLLNLIHQIQNGSSTEMHTVSFEKLLGSGCTQETAVLTSVYITRPNKDIQIYIPN